MLVQLTLVIKTFGNIRIHDYLSFNHLLIDNMLTRYVDYIVRMTFRRSRYAYLYLRIDFLQHLCALVSRLRPEQMFLVYHNHNRQSLFFLRTTGYFIYRHSLFRVAHHHVLFLVDAFPVHKQYFSRFDEAFALVQFVVHHRPQQVGFTEEVLHLEVALLVQFIRRNPYICHLLIRAVAARLQFLRQVVQHLRSHYGFTCTRRRFKDKRFSVT